MEDLGLSVQAAVSPPFWRDKRVFVTGHTGFKGSWLVLWLRSLGAIVKGYALPPPTAPALFEVARVAEGIQSEIGDIRDGGAVARSLSTFEPHVLFHLAAQPLVRLSYREPAETYATNVMGTLNVLEAARQCRGLQAIVNVTTDKCYENREWDWGYRENDPMGGSDPYSSSKGCVELLTNAYRRSYGDGPLAALASARAGNVIGGGDWAQDRLVPDILRAFDGGVPVIVRNPASVRPWQHVLEPLSGYLVLAERLAAEGRNFAEGWNFGPSDADARTVGWILTELCAIWGEGASWQTDDAEQPHEARSLKLDISKARNRLGWGPSWSLEHALSRIVAWHRAWRKGDDMRDVCLEEIAAYANAMTISSPAVGASIKDFA